MPNLLLCWLEWECSLKPYTLNRGKGKFARVCLNVDVTKPLRGTLTIPTSEAILSVPISYEGLHEVCAICGSTAHPLDTYPNTPKNVFEVIVEKFGATSLQPGTEINLPSIGAPSQLPPKTWVTVLPKKRSRLPNSHRKCGMLTTPSHFNAPKVNTVSPSHYYHNYTFFCYSQCGGEKWLCLQSLLLILRSLITMIARPSSVHLHLLPLSQGLIFQYMMRMT